MKAKALWVTANTYGKYVVAVNMCEGHTVEPLFRVNETYLVLRDWNEDGMNMYDCTTYGYEMFHRNYWRLEAHSYTEFFEVEHV